MSVGHINKGEYKIAAKVGGMKELKDIDLYTGDQIIYDLVHEQNYAGTKYVETFPLGTADTNFEAPEFLVPEDGLYYLSFRNKVFNPSLDYNRALVVTNALRVRVNDTILPSIFAMVNYVNERVNFVMPLKKGTRIQVSYTHDGSDANVGWNAEIFCFAKLLNQ